MTPDAFCGRPVAVAPGVSQGKPCWTVHWWNKPDSTVRITQRPIQDVRALRYQALNAARRSGGRQAIKNVIEYDAILAFEGVK